MNSNRIIKILCSFPVILIASYFLPFIGVCLIIIRYFVHSTKKCYSTSLILIIFGGLILIPKVIVKVLDIAKIESVNILYLDTIINSEIYPNLLNYSKFLITVGIIFLLISLIFKNLFNKLSNYIRSFINVREQIDADNRQRNDIEIKIKQEKSKNTQVVYCPHCGADNILTEAVGKCKYCRRSLNSKKKR